MPGRLGAVLVVLASGAGSLLGVGVAHATVPVTAGGGVPTTRADVQAATPLPRRAALGDALAAATPLRITVALRPRAGLAAYAAAVSNPRSPAYRHDLTVAQFRARFGARPAAVTAVRATLRRAGLRVGALGANGLALTASGRASGVQRVFDTRLRHVTLADGRHAFLDVVAPTLPVAIASSVQGVVGLQSLPLVAPEGLVRPRSRPHLAAQAGAVGAGPSTCAKAQAAGNTAQDIASAYGLSGLWQAGDVGAGATVALYELEPFAAGDIGGYESCYGISTAVNVTSVDGGAGTGSGQGEAALDIEDVAGLAPGATIDVYEGPNRSSGPYDVYRRIVTADAAQVVSTSWGACEADVGSAYAQEEATLFEEAAAQGQTVYAAAGDSGADDCGTGTQAVDDPASQPDVTGVGGTSLPSWAAPRQETVWNDAEGAGGGGASTLWSAPSYQSSLGATAREVPDVSADADPQTGYAIYWAGAWTTFGGTSAAAPTWAALTALALRSSSCAGVGHGLGLVNDSLYGLSADFYDVTGGDNGYDGVTGYDAGPGYDMASGLGAPDGTTLVPALCRAGSGAAVDDPVLTTSPTSTTTAATTTTTTTTPAPGPTPPPTTTTTTTTTPAPGTPGTPAAPVTTTGGSPGRHPAPAVIAFSAPARVDDAVGARVHVSLHARDRAGRRLSYVADGLPRGLSIDRATGTVTGRPRHAGTSLVSVSAVDTAGDARSVVIRWRVAARRATSRR